MDDEVKGKGKSVNYKYRMHDPRIGRFFAVDPLAPEYPHNSPYAFSENMVIHGVELEGLEFRQTTNSNGDTDYTYEGYTVEGDQAVPVAGTENNVQAGNTYFRASANTIPINENGQTGYLLEEEYSIETLNDDGSLLSYTYESNYSNDSYFYSSSNTLTLSAPFNPSLYNIDGSGSYYARASVRARSGSYSSGEELNSFNATVSRTNLGIMLEEKKFGLANPPPPLSSFEAYDASTRWMYQQPQCAMAWDGFWQFFALSGFSRAKISLGKSGLTTAPYQKAIVRTPLNKTASGRYYDGFYVGKFRFQIHKHKINGQGPYPHINFGKNGRYHLFEDGNIVKGNP